jgi:hypothetical protein
MAKTTTSNVAQATLELLTGNRWTEVRGVRHLALCWDWTRTACGETCPKAEPMSNEWGSIGGLKAGKVTEHCITCVAVSRAGDWIGKEKSLATGRTYRWPLLCVCGTGCGGHRSVFIGTGLSIDRPELAHEIALIQYGYASMREWDNGPPGPPCNCAAEVPKLRERANTELPWVDRGEWKRVGGLAHRGIHDYARTMVFGAELSAEQRSLLSVWLQKDGCPGWTGVSLRIVERRLVTWTYIATTTYDSSD